MEGEVVSVGQARGFDESYQACYGRLLRQVALVTADLADAEDVLQEAYARAAIRWRQLETDDAPEAWVLRVAMNLAADTTRRLRRRAAAMLRLGPPPTQPELSADSVDLIRALAALPLGQRQAIVLHHLVGRPVDEISRQLGVPSGTVKARLARGRTALARRLGTDFCPVHGRRLSMNDLQARLDRAADELTQAAIPPPVVAIRRRGRRRQQRLVAAAMVVVAIVAGLWGPGAGLFNRGQWHRLPLLARQLRRWVSRRRRSVLGRSPLSSSPQLMGSRSGCWSKTSSAPPTHILARVCPSTASSPSRVRCSEGTELGQYLTIQNGTARSQLQAADGSRGWAVGPHRLTDHNGKTIQPPGTALAAFTWWCKDITEESPSTTTP